MIKLPQITRLEINDEFGRAFSRYDLGGVSLETKDAGETLCITLDFEGEDECNTATVLQAVLFLLTCEEPDIERAVETIEDHLEALVGGKDE